MARRLSGRERQIIDCVAVGLTTKQIATLLRIAPSTVDWHIANAIAKLHAANRAEAVAIVLRGGDTAPGRRERLRATAGWMADRWRVAAVAVLVAVGLPLLVAGDVRRDAPTDRPTAPAGTIAPRSAAPVLPPSAPTPTASASGATLGPTAAPPAATTAAATATARPAPLATLFPPVASAVPAPPAVPLPILTGPPAPTVPVAPSLAPSLVPLPTASPLPTLLPVSVPTLPAVPGVTASPLPSLP